MSAPAWLQLVPEPPGWGEDPDTVPDYLEVLAEARRPRAPSRTERLHQICDVFGVDPGPLDVRLGALLERGLQRQAEAEEEPSDGVEDVFDSLVGCELTARQLCEDTGRTLSSIIAALEWLRWERFVSRERRGGVWTYRATVLGVRALRGGR